MSDPLYARCGRPVLVLSVSKRVQTPASQVRTSDDAVEALNIDASTQDEFARELLCIDGSRAQFGVATCVSARGIWVRTAECAR
jgi:hypothetical protein